MTASFKGIRISKPIVKEISSFGSLTNIDLHTDPYEKVEAKALSRSRLKNQSVKKTDLRITNDYSSLFVSIENKKNTIPDIHCNNLSKRPVGFTDSYVPGEALLCPDDPNLVNELFDDVLKRLREEKSDSGEQFHWDANVTLSQENKWSFITGYLSRNDKFLKISSNDSELNVKASVISYIEKLSCTPLKLKYVESLAVALRTESVTWVRYFLLMGGHIVLAKILQAIHEKKHLKSPDITLEIAILKSMRCIIGQKIGTDFYLSNKYPIDSVVHCLLSTKLLVRKLAAELLTFLCYSEKPNGINAIMKCMKNFANLKVESMNVFDLWLSQWKRTLLEKVVTEEKKVLEEAALHDKITIEYIISQMLLINAFLENIPSKTALLQFKESLRIGNFKSILLILKKINDEGVLKQLEKCVKLVSLDTANEKHFLKHTPNSAAHQSLLNTNMFNDANFEFMVKEHIKNFLKLLKEHNNPVRIIKLLDCLVLTLQADKGNGNSNNDIDCFYKELKIGNEQGNNAPGYSSVTSGYGTTNSKKVVASYDNTDDNEYSVSKSELYATGDTNNTTNQGYENSERKYVESSKYETDLKNIFDCLCLLFPSEFDPQSSFSAEKIFSKLKHLLTRTRDSYISEDTKILRLLNRSSSKLQDRDQEYLISKNNVNGNGNRDWVQPVNTTSSVSAFASPRIKPKLLFQPNQDEKLKLCKLDLAKANSITLKSEPSSAVSTHSFEVHLSMPGTQIKSANLAEKMETSKHKVFNPKRIDVVSDLPLDYRKSYYGRFSITDTKRFSKIENMRIKEVIDGNPFKAPPPAPLPPPAPPLPTAMSSLQKFEKNDSQIFRKTIIIPENISIDDIFKFCSGSESEVYASKIPGELCNPSKRLKQLHWKRLEVPFEKTLWNIVVADPYLLTLKLTAEGIFKQLEDCYPLREVTVSNKKVKEYTGFMPVDLQQMVSIRLHRFNSLTPIEIAKKFFHCDHDIMELVDFFNDRKFFRQEGLKKQLKPYMSSRNEEVMEVSEKLLELSRFDQIYTLIVVDIDTYYEKRMAALKIKSFLANNFRDFRRQIRKLHCASLELKSSLHFKYFLNLVLHIGNFMNDAPRRAKGYRLESLLRASMIKNDKTGLTLLHTIEKIVRTHFPQLEAFLVDLKAIPEISRFNLEQLEQDCNDICERMKNVEKDFSNEGIFSNHKALHPDDHICEVMVPWIPSGKSMVDELNSDITELKTTLKTTLLMYGENPDEPTSSARFFNNLNEIILEYKKASTVNQKMEKEEELAFLRLQALKASVKSNNAENSGSSKNEEVSATMENLISQLQKGLCDDSLSNKTDCTESSKQTIETLMNYENDKQTLEGSNKKRQTVVLKAECMLKQLENNNELKR